jgi:hypothetical protein
MKRTQPQGGAQMNELALADALALAERHPVFVATADSVGTPHLGCAGALDRTGGQTLEVTEWFCPVTLTKVTQNPRVSVRESTWRSG